MNWEGNSEGRSLLEAFIKYTLSSIYACQVQLFYRGQLSSG